MAKEGFGLNAYIGAELIERVTDEEEVAHLVVLGSLEKVNHELKPEKSVTFRGIKSAETWYLPQARRTEKVAEHYLPQLLKRGVLVFDCEGRSCGSSSYWANRVLEEAVLYGPEQYQRYFVVSLPEERGYVYAYIAQRATRKIYVRFEQIVNLVVDSAVFPSNMRALPDVVDN